MREITVSNIDSAEWTKKTVPGLGLTVGWQDLAVDEDTGMFVRHYIYPAGYTTRWHVHHCSHGIYVLSGKLRTHQGVYGPGTLVWFPEGEPAEHGPTEDEDLECLFITI